MATRKGRGRREQLGAEPDEKGLGGWEHWKTGTGIREGWI